MRKLYVLIAVGTLLLVAWFTYRSGSLASSASATATTPQSVPVVVARVERHDAPRMLPTIGTVQAFNTVLVRARVDGTLDNVAFTEGQRVQRGDLLAQIDPRPFETQLHAATAQKAHDAAQLANVERDIARFTYLANQKILPQQQLDSTRAQADELRATVAMDQAQIDNARVQLSYATIRAPLDGLTGARLVDAGNMVHASDTTGLVVITQIHPISVSFTLPQDALPALLSARQQSPIGVIAQNRDASQTLGKGVLSLIDNQIDAATGTIHCKATFDNANETLWPGQFVALRVVLAVDRGALAVPSTAVQQGSTGTYVFVLMPDDTVALRYVKVASTEDSRSVVAQGLAEGDRVVVEGQFKLEDGAHVRVVDDSAHGH
ncbi:multidrug transporter [Dyella lipolytica]|uniref:Efflux RND transporter periplasmic adaptor subunit n=1 Tax=Dyella lipolytica TaxID=1867835 RepID=A0ABW8IZP6_9GAMM|nr:efflux RND transporter periplasmic adaptor subunit [Dyella lipolytica]GLQ45884.1 multidrug transporter [Dyella lipolytica]